MCSLAIMRSLAIMCSLARMCFRTRVCSLTRMCSLNRERLVKEQLDALETKLKVRVSFMVLSLETYL
jgi:hypothetical protein